MPKDESRGVKRGGLSPVEHGRATAPGFPDDGFVTPLTSAPAAGDLGEAPVTDDFGAFDTGPTDPMGLMPSNPKRSTKRFEGTR